MGQQICISPAPGRSSKLTHTGVERPDGFSIFQCRLGHIGLCFTQFELQELAGQLAACGVASVWK